MPLVRSALAVGLRRNGRAKLGPGWLPRAAHITLTAETGKHPATVYRWVDSWINCHGVWSGLTAAAA